MLRIPWARQKNGSRSGPAPARDIAENVAVSSDMSLDENDSVLGNRRRPAVSKPSVLVNFLQALLAIVLGNVVYFVWFHRCRRWRGTTPSIWIWVWSWISGFVWWPTG